MTILGIDVYRFCTYAKCDFLLVRKIDLYALQKNKIKFFSVYVNEMVICEYYLREILGCIVPSVCRNFLLLWKAFWMCLCHPMIKRDTYSRIFSRLIHTRDILQSCLLLKSFCFLLASRILLTFRDLQVLCTIGLVFIWDSLNVRCFLFQRFNP